MAQTVVLELHDECFEIWERFARGGEPRPTTEADATEDEEDEA